MNKQALNWLAKEWLNRVAVSGKSGYTGRSYVNPETRKIFSMMDTSKKRIANPGAAIRDDRYGQLIKDNLSDKNYISQVGANRMVTEDVQNLRNEYARMFLTKAMKSKGSVDELAVRQFVKENPKMVEQLLVKNDAIPAGLNAREIASRLSQMYPDGMIKGPVAYERGITGYAQRQFDKTKNTQLIRVPGTDARFMPADHGFSDRIVISGKRSDPVSFLHESDEALNWQALPIDKKQMSMFYHGESLGNELAKAKDKISAHDIAKNYIADTQNMIGSHVSPNVLINESKVFGKVPRYIDPLQRNIDKIRSARDASNEYATIGTMPEVVVRDDNSILRPLYITPPFRFPE